MLQRKLRSALNLNYLSLWKGSPVNPGVTVSCGRLEAFFRHRLVDLMVFVIRFVFVNEYYVCVCFFFIVKMIFIFDLDWGLILIGSMYLVWIQTYVFLFFQRQCWNQNKHYWINNRIITKCIFAKEFHRIQDFGEEFNVNSESNNRTQYINRGERSPKPRHQNIRQMTISVQLAETMDLWSSLFHEYLHLEACPVSLLNIKCHLTFIILWTKYNVSNLSLLL